MVVSETELCLCKLPPGHSQLELSRETIASDASKPSSPAKWSPSSVPKCLGGDLDAVSQCYSLVSAMKQERSRTESQSDSLASNLSTRSTVSVSFSDAAPIVHSYDASDTETSDSDEDNEASSSNTTPNRVYRHSYGATAYARCARGSTFGEHTQSLRQSPRQSLRRSFSAGRRGGGISLDEASLTTKFQTYGLAFLTLGMLIFLIWPEAVASVVQL